MNAAILSIRAPPPLAFAVWLGGAGLAVCGLFVVQYFSVKAFSITDEDMNQIVDSKTPYIDLPLLAVAMITPVVTACWAAILFAIGVFDYLIRSDLGGGKYRAIAIVPVGAGLMAVALTIILGEKLARKVEQRYDTKSDTDSKE